jgi:hypothetical protein
LPAYGEVRQVGDGGLHLWPANHPDRLLAEKHFKAATSTGHIPGTRYPVKTCRGSHPMMPGKAPLALRWVTGVKPRWIAFMLDARDRPRYLGDWATRHQGWKLLYLVKATVKPVDQASTSG